MNIPGKRVKIERWVHGRRCAVCVEIEAVIPDAEPSEPCLEMDAIRRLHQLQQWADAGKTEELEKHGTVYVPLQRSA